MESIHLNAPVSTAGIEFDTRFLRRNCTKVVIQEIPTRRYWGSRGVWTSDIEKASDFQTGSSAGTRATPETPERATGRDPRIQGVPGHPAQDERQIVTWPAFYRMSPGTFSTGVKPQAWRAAKGESSPRAFLWRSRTPDSGNRPKTRSFGACYVLKVNLNVPNMHGPQGLDSVELLTSQKELVGIGLREKINLGVDIRSEVSSRAFSPIWVRTLENRAVRNHSNRSRWCRTNGETGYHACAGDFTRAVLPLVRSSKDICAFEIQPSRDGRTLPFEGNVFDNHGSACAKSALDGFGGCSGPKGELTKEVSNA